MISDAKILPFLPSFQKIARFLSRFVATNQEISDKMRSACQNLSFSPQEILLNPNKSVSL